MPSPARCAWSQAAAGMEILRARCSPSHDYWASTRRPKRTLCPRTRRVRRIPTQPPSAIPFRPNAHTEKHLSTRYVRPDGRWAPWYCCPARKDAASRPLWEMSTTGSSHADRPGVSAAWIRANPQTACSAMRPDNSSGREEFPRTSHVRSPSQIPWTADWWPVCDRSRNRWR